MTPEKRIQLLLRAERRIHRMVWRSSELPTFSLQVLAALLDGQTNASALSKVMDCGHREITAVLAELEESGLVVREPSAGGGKIRLVAITEEGRAILSQLGEKVNSVIDPSLEQLGVSEKQFEYALRLIVRVCSSPE